VTAKTVFILERRLDNLWSTQPMRFDYTAEYVTASPVESYVQDNAEDEDDLDIEVPKSLRPVPTYGKVGYGTVKQADFRMFYTHSTRYIILLDTFTIFTTTHYHRFLCNLIFFSLNNSEKITFYL
jgi:hypothetical protein